MRESTKTLIFVAVALLLTGAAALSMPRRGGSSLDFNDQGQRFFPDFKDPLACTDLDVTDYDPATASYSKFQVKFQDGKWVIPSHYNYPADAKDRLSKTASGVIDLTKDTIRSDRAEDQEEMGVIDPLETSTTSLKGRGKRVTLRDQTEKVLADLIIGKEIRDRAGSHYVRVPGQKRIYGVKMSVDLSTKFADWIETNLLKLEASHVRRVKFDNHKVDPEQGVVLKGDVVEIERNDGFGPWKIVGQEPAAGQEMNAEKLTALASALGDLKIVGVRTKPDWLSKDLKLGKGPVSKDQPKTREEEQKQFLAFRSLQAKGFYPTRDGGLYSNQGDVVVSTDEGVVYTLRFGEVFVASGTDLSAGTSGEAEKDKDAEKTKDPSKKKAEGAPESRYVLVTASFDPSLLPPEHPAKGGPLTIPDDPFQRAPDDPKRLAEEKAAQEKAERETAEHKRRVGEGEKKVKDLTDRFADWYYVTPGESFRAIALSKSDLTRPKQDKKANPADMPELPGMPDFKHP